MVRAPPSSNTTFEGECGGNSKSFRLTPACSTVAWVKVKPANCVVTASRSVRESNVMVAALASWTGAQSSTVRNVRRRAGGQWRFGIATDPSIAEANIGSWSPVVKRARFVGNRERGLPGCAPTQSPGGSTPQIRDLRRIRHTTDGSVLEIDGRHTD